MCIVILTRILIVYYVYYSNLHSIQTLVKYSDAIHVPACSLISEAYNSFSACMLPSTRLTFKWRMLECSHMCWRTLNIFNEIHSSLSAGTVTWILSIPFHPCTSWILWTRGVSICSSKCRQRASFLRKAGFTPGHRSWVDFRAVSLVNKLSEIVESFFFIAGVSILQKTY